MKKRVNRLFLVSSFAALVSMIHVPMYAYKFKVKNELDKAYYVRVNVSGDEKVKFVKPGETVDFGKFKTLRCLTNLQIKEEGSNEWRTINSIVYSIAGFMSGSLVPLVALCGNRIIRIFKHKEGQIDFDVKDYD